MTIEQFEAWLRDPAFPYPELKNLIEAPAEVRQDFYQTCIESSNALDLTFKQVVRMVHETFCENTGTTPAPRERND